MSDSHKHMGRLADYYDWLYGGLFTEDIEMYATLARDKKRLLECAVGTGRVAIPLARRGFHVMGFDHSPDMLCVARNKLSHEQESVRQRLELVQADMRSFNLGTQFDFIYIPLESFNHLLNIQDQLAALICIKSHLLLDGMLVMDLFSPHHFKRWLSAGQELKLRLANKNPESGETIVQTRVTTMDVATQLVFQYRLFEIFDRDGNSTRRFSTEWECRVFFRGEMELLLEKAGFHAKEVYGDYTFGPYSSESDIMVCVAEPNVI